MTVQELEPYKEPMVRTSVHRITAGKDRVKKIFLFFFDIPMGADEDRAKAGSAVDGWGYRKETP